MAKMNNSYIDGLISPSRNRGSAQQSKADPGMEVSEAQTTKNHLVQRNLNQAEKIRKQNIRARNIALAQSDDPLVDQAENRRRQNAIKRMSGAVDWDFTEENLRAEQGLNRVKPFEANPRLDTGGARGLALQGGARNSRRLGEINDRRADDFVQPVRAFGLLRKRNNKASAKDLAGNYGEGETSAEIFLGGENTLNLNSDDLYGKKKGRKRKPSSEDKKPKKNFFRRHLKLTVFVLFLAVIGLGVYIYGDRLIAKMTGGKSGFIDLIKTAVTEKFIPLKADAQGRTNIVIFGTSGYDMAGHEGKNIHDGAQLTDSLMVMSIDQNSKNAVTMSLPRDLKVGREACYAGKINEIYTCASNNGKNEEAGATAVMKEMTKITGFDMHYYIHINWGSLVQIVDALGGITVTVKDDINDYYYTGIKMKAGVPTQLNGEKALGLARARHGSVGGDFTRGENQQRVLVGIKERIAEKGMDIPAMINLMNVLGDNLRTNVNIDEIKTAAKVFSEFNPSNIATARLTGLEGGDLVRTASYPVGGIDVSFVIPSTGPQNYTKIQKHLESIIAGQSDSPATARILVLNGANVAGLAADEKIELEKAGFKVTGTGNAPQGEYLEKVSLYSVGTKVETKKKLEEHYGLTAKEATELPKGIDKTDYDFVIILGKEPKN